MTSSKTLGIAALLTIASLAAALATAHEEPNPGERVVQYFGVDNETLVLTALPPSAKSPETWTQSGFYDPRQGVKIEIPLQNEDADAFIREDEGVSGWVSVAFSVQRTSTVPSVFGPGSGSFSWKLVEGARSAPLVLDCRYNNVYYCEQEKKEPRYVASFPGHGDGNRPHTHGDGSSADTLLQASEFEWLLSYKVPPCSVYSCPLLYGTYRYTFSVVVDGSTFVEYVVDAGLRAAQAEPPADDGATDNSTQGGNSTGDGGNSTNGNGTSNGTGSQGSSASAPGFGPEGYQAQPSGSAPGVPVAVLLLGLAGVGFVVRRRRRGG